MKTVMEPARSVPVVWEGDLAVIGGGCTGVFAAVQAARRGLRVALIEAGGRLGGAAGSGQVGVWHSLYSTDGAERIIAGLTEECCKRMHDSGDAIYGKDISTAVRFNTAVLACELDALTRENGVRLFLHTLYVGAVKDGSSVDAVLIENKDGRGAVKASFFIDASGDGDLCRDAGLESYRRGLLQPPTSVFLMQMGAGADIGRLVLEHGAEFGLEDDWGWSDIVPGLRDITLRADFHTFHADCSRADDLTRTELDGRRKALALTRMLQKYADPAYRLVSLPASAGIRETAHYVTGWQATERALLCGGTYEDTVMKGCYRVDVHHDNDNGITFKDLDGTRTVCYGKGGRSEKGTWFDEFGFHGPCATHYEIPFRILQQDAVSNLIPAGRMVHADEGAFGALRVMVNLNQLGEAAGCAAYLALQEGKAVKDIDGVKVRRLLRESGSAL